MQKRRANNYPRKKATVQITVYVVKLQQRRPPKLQLLSNLQSRGGSYRHLSPALKPPAGSPYDRKAQLLHYSQQLRATATFLKHEPSLLTTPQPHHHHKHYSNQHLQLTGAAHRLQITTTAAGNKPHQKNINDPTWKVVEAEQMKSGVAAEAATSLPPPPPSCFGDWKKLFFPSFCAKEDVVAAGHVKSRKRRSGRKKNKTVIVSLGRKISAIMMSSRMEKERIGVIAKFLSVIGKHR
ncbi:hypothetical protein KSP40_PGU016998 [Platanthera guangdongensis]|uniref:Uncharacterized protein n=1 Tax=Platanthera guangdongensis TaxID=2320717 RepID=A0ABR2MXI5_9ASPA